jgi:hypothetical protein
VRVGGVERLAPDLPAGLGEQPRDAARVRPRGLDRVGDPLLGARAACLGVHVVLLDGVADAAGGTGTGTEGAASAADRQDAMEVAASRGASWEWRGSSTAATPA